MNFAKNLFGQVMVNYQTHKHTRSTFPSDDRGAAEKFQLWSILLGKEETTPLLFPYGKQRLQHTSTFDVFAKTKDKWPTVCWKMDVI